MKLVLTYLLLFCMSESSTNYALIELTEDQTLIDNSLLLGSGIQKKLKKLKVKIKIDRKSRTGYYIPKSFNEAVNELDMMLLDDSKKLILENDWTSGMFIDRHELFYKLADFLQDKWNLKSNNLFSTQLQKYGVYHRPPDISEMEGNSSIIWVLEALLKGVYNLHNPDAKLQKLLIFYGMISTKMNLIDYSGDVPFEDPPKECNVDNNSIKEFWLKLEGSNIYLNTRRMYYIYCEDKLPIVYLVDRGWFSPNESLLKKIPKDVKRKKIDYSGKL